MPEQHDAHVAFYLADLALLDAQTNGKERSVIGAHEWVAYADRDPWDNPLLPFERAWRVSVWRAPSPESRFRNDWETGATSATLRELIHGLRFDDNEISRSPSPEPDARETPRPGPASRES